MTAPGLAEVRFSALYSFDPLRAALVYDLVYAAHVDPDNRPRLDGWIWAIPASGAEIYALRNAEDEIMEACRDTGFRSLPAPTAEEEAIRRRLVKAIDKLDREWNRADRAMVADMVGEIRSGNLHWALLRWENMAMAGMGGFLDSPTAWFWEHGIRWSAPLEKAIVPLARASIRAATRSPS